MTDNNTRDANETANADKGENIVHIAKDGAEELQKIKRSLNLKKTWATRSLNQLIVRAKALKNQRPNITQIKLQQPEFIYRKRPKMYLKQKAS